MHQSCRQCTRTVWTSLNILVMHKQNRREFFGACLTVLCFFIAFLMTNSCAKKRTSDETKRQLIGRWETVTEMDSEMSFVFTDSILKTEEEFGLNGRYTISDLDSLTVFDFHGPLTFKLRFSGSGTAVTLTASGWDVIRLEKILDKK
jgi:hypothetical protein